MKLSSIGSGFLCAALLCGPASAVETIYPAANQALPMQQAAGTARAMAMGSAVVAVSQGSASLLWNPAGLSRMTCTEIGLHHNTGLANTLQEIAITGSALGEAREDGKGGSLGGIAASIGFVDYGRFDGRDAAGLPAPSYTAGDVSGSLGWGMEWFPGISAGAALKGNQTSLDGKRYDSIAADVGLLWNVIPRVDLGAAYSNINLGKKIGGAQLSGGWRLGAAWNADKHLILAASGELQNKGMNRIQLGTEYLIGNLEEKANVLALRAGYQVNYPKPELTGLTGLTYGLGYTLTRSLALDYAMLPTGDLGASHRLSLTFKFDCPAKRQPPTAAVYAPAPIAAAIEPPPVLAPVRPLPVFVPVKPRPIILKAILLEDSHFDFDKSTLRPEGMTVLRENAQLLRDNPQTMVRVAGYTSMMGTVEYNQLLSERRAAAVEEFLITEGGISPSRISTIGYGETQPATFEATPGVSNTAAAKSNMRVLFEVSVR